MSWEQAPSPGQTSGTRSLFHAGTLESWVWRCPQEGKEMELGELMALPCRNLLLKQPGPGIRNTTKGDVGDRDHPPGQLCLLVFGGYRGFNSEALNH